MLSMSRPVRAGLVDAVHCCGAAVLLASGLRAYLGWRILPADLRQITLYLVAGFNAAFLLEFGAQYSCTSTHSPIGCWPGVGRKRVANAVGGSQRVCQGQQTSGLQAP